ncbi:MAG: CaiB/BaiF CoA-transferase family protein [Alphaproteobacteria bacterium]
MASSNGGPLKGLKIVEMAGIGPGPFCGMLLSDLGAEVVRVDRVEPSGLGVAIDQKFQVYLRGRPSVAVDLKNPKAVEVVLRLIEKADAMFEGFRPGVMERLGLGPDVCLARNKRLVYGRMTGWGQNGPMAPRAGHDLNYIALSGALHNIGEKGRKPVPPLNLIGDFGGGGLLLAFGLLAAVFEARSSGQGQVVDVAMAEGAAMLAAPAYGHRAAGIMTDERGGNMLDGGSHFYNTYETRDGKWVSVASVEDKFYRILLDKLGLDPKSLPGQMDKSQWPAMQKKFADIFKTKTRDEWCRVLGDTDACFAPVLSLSEAPDHPHNKARGAFIDVSGVRQPAPTPRFSRSVPRTPAAGGKPGSNTEEGLAAWGFARAEIDALLRDGVVGWRGADQKK